MGTFQPRKTGFFGRMGISGDAVYWVSFATGLVVLVLLIVEIVSSLGG